MSRKPPPPPTEETFKKRERVLLELVETEKTFVKNLQTLITSYIENFRIADTDIKKSIISNSSLAVLFSNIEQIHTVNVDLLERLKQRIQSRTINNNNNNNNNNKSNDNNKNNNNSVVRGSSPPPPAHSPPPQSNNILDDKTPLIGDIFLQFAPRFKLYAQYTATHDKASKVIHDFKDNVDFQNLLKQILIERANKATNKNAPQQNMDSFFIMPVQRVPRYKLLLKEIHKYTPEKHSDRETLLEALDAVDGTAHLINETIRQREEFDRLVRLESQFPSDKISLAKHGRRLIKEGKLTKRGRKTNQQYHFHLFNDILLYSKSHNAQNTSFTLHRRIDLAYTNISTENLGNLKGAFSIISKEKSFVVFAENDIDKDMWVTKIKESIDETHLNHIRSQSRSKISRSNTILTKGGKNKRNIQSRRISTLDTVAQANVWVPDDAESVCKFCLSNFTLIRRRHHCRKCGSLVCDSCSLHRLFLPNVDTVPVRVCDNCAESMQQDKMKALRLELHILSVEMQGDLNKDGNGNVENNRYNKKSSNKDVYSNNNNGSSSRSLLKNMFSSSSSSGSSKFSSNGSFKSKKNNPNDNKVGRYAKVYLNDQLHGQTETAYYDKASLRFPFGSKGVYFDVCIPRIALGIDEAGHEITIVIQVYETVRNSISKDVLIGTSQLKPFEVLMVTSTLRETKDGALASKERQEGAARFHYDVLEKWQERQNEKNDSSKMMKTKSSNFSSAHSFSSMDLEKSSFSSVGLETINPLAILEQRKRAVQVFPTSGVSALPMVRERGFNSNGDNIYSGLHNEEDIEMCGEVHVSFGLIVPLNLEKVNTVVQVETWISRVVAEYHARVADAKVKLQRKQVGMEEEDHDNEDIDPYTLMTVDRVADAQMIKLLIDYCIVKCNVLEQNEEESKDDDEVEDAERESFHKISTVEEINELEDSIINVSDMKTKLLTIGKRKNSTIEILQSLKENFETNPDTLAFLPLLEAYRQKVQGRKTLSAGLAKGESASSLDFYDAKGGNMYDNSKYLTDDLLKTRDDYIYKLLLSEEEYVETLHSVIERIINPALAHHSGANVNTDRGRNRGQSAVKKLHRSDTNDVSASAEMDESKKEDETRAVIALNAIKQIVTLHEEILKALIQIVDNDGISLSVSFNRSNRNNSILNKQKSGGNAKKQSDTNKIMIGKLFNNFGSSFKMYSEYGNNFEYMIRYFKNTKSINTIIKNYRLYLFVDIGMFEGKNEDIVYEQMERPTKRLNEYMNLITGLIKITEESHKDVKHLKLAMKQFEGVNHHIQLSNDIRKNKEQLFKMENSIIMEDGSYINLVTKDRKFIRCGPLIKVCRRVNKEFYFWLLSDQLIYGHSVGNGKFKYHRSLSLTNCKVVDIDYGEGPIIKPTGNMAKKNSTKRLLHRVASLHVNRLSNARSVKSDPKTFQCTFTIQSNLKSFVAIVPARNSSKYGLEQYEFKSDIASEENSNVLIDPEMEGTSVEIGKAWIRDIEKTIAKHRKGRKTIRKIELVEDSMKTSKSGNIDGKTTITTTTVTTTTNKNNSDKNNDDYDSDDDDAFIAPVWKPDAASKNCFICDKPFQFLIRRRHHCRKCGILCCDSCSPYKELIVSIDDKNESRICKNCHETKTMLV